MIVTLSYIRNGILKDKHIESHVDHMTCNYSFSTVSWFMTVSILHFLFPWYSIKYKEYVVIQHRKGFQCLPTFYHVCPDKTPSPCLSQYLGLSLSKILSQSTEATPTNYE